MELVQFYNVMSKTATNTHTHKTLVIEHAHRRAHFEASRPLSDMNTVSVTPTAFLPMRVTSVFVTVYLS